MKQVPYGGTKFDSLFDRRHAVRKLAGSGSYHPIFVIPGKDAPVFLGDKPGNVGQVVVGMEWLIEHEPELAQATEFEGYVIDDWYAEAVLKKAGK